MFRGRLGQLLRKVVKGDYLRCSNLKRPKMNSIIQNDNIILFKFNTRMKNTSIKLRMSLIVKIKLKLN